MRISRAQIKTLILVKRPFKATRSVVDVGSGHLRIGIIGPRNETVAIAVRLLEIPQNARVPK